VRKALADDLVVATLSEVGIDRPEVLTGKEQVHIRVLPRRPDAQELLGPAAEDPCSRSSERTRRTNARSFRTRGRCR
jgi:hypothetical protein